MGASEVAKLHQLQNESRMLSRLVADVSLDKHVLPNAPKRN